MKEMIFSIEVISGKVQGLGSCDLTIIDQPMEEIATMFEAITTIAPKEVEYFGESYNGELYIDFVANSISEAESAFYKLLNLCSGATNITLIHRNPQIAGSANTIVSEFGSLGCFYLL